MRPGGGMEKFEPWACQLVDEFLQAILRLGFRLYRVWGVEKAFFPLLWCPKFFLKITYSQKGGLV